MTDKIFLNYRRTDAEAWADRLFERLIKHVPRENVFLDIDGAIPVGRPWAAWLDSQVAQCDLMLVLIGRTWAAEFAARAAPGERDFVRVEIESALKRDIPVVPVFLGDAPEPRATDLPESIRPLLDLQAVRLQRLSFEGDAERLITDAKRSIALSKGLAVPAPAAGAATLPVAPVVASPTEAQRHAAEGRVWIPTPMVQGAPAGTMAGQSGGWFKPGAGGSEWFRDHPTGPELVVVPAGAFWMGLPPHEAERTPAEDPQHRVTIACPFAVGRFAVTFDEWDAAQEHPAWKEHTKLEPRRPNDQGWGRGRRPVIDVSWQDATAYCTWLSKVTGQTYRLLSEAEWEYACRAGTTTTFHFGETISTDQANYDGNYTYGPGGKKGVYRQKTIEVGSLNAPNVWGLHDLHGNVWEWCMDNWHDTYAGAPSDGSAWTTGGDTSRRVVRGGSWGNDPQNLRAALRGGNAVGYRGYDIGFRVARPVSSPRTF